MPKALPPPPPPPKASFLEKAAGFVIVTLLAAGTGGGLAYMVADPGPKAPRPDVAVAAGTRPVETGSMIRLAPIVTNLARPSEIWVRLEGSLVVEGVEPERARVLAAEVGSDVMAYLRTLALSQIEGASGLQALREDLAERVRLRSGGKARELVIETLVVQ